MITIIEPITGDLKNDSEMILEYLESHGVRKSDIAFSQIESGFSTIESEFQGMVNGAQVALMFKKGLGEQCRGVVIDCFDDPGVAACQEIGGIPAIGTYQAAIATASVLGDRIGVITTDVPGITNEEKKARCFGVENKVVSIMAIDTPVMDILTDSDSITDALFDACLKMEKEDRVTVVCFGCTGMYPVADALKRKLKQSGSKVSIVEPILNAVLMMRNIIAMDCSTDTPVVTTFDGYRS